jgi:hypothetical protein
MPPGAVAKLASAADRRPKPFEQVDSVRLDMGGQEPYGIRIENLTQAMERDVQEACRGRGERAERDGHPDYTALRA